MQAFVINIKTWNDYVRVAVGQKLQSTLLFCLLDLITSAASVIVCIRVIKDQGSQNSRVSGESSEGLIPSLGAIHSWKPLELGEAFPFDTVITGGGLPMFRWMISALHIRTSLSGYSRL